MPHSTATGNRNPTDLPAEDVLLAEPGRRGAPKVDQPLAHLANRSRRSAVWLEATYPMPRGTRSLEEYLRRQHQDLPSHSGLDIDLELDAVRRRLRFESNPRHIAWLHERADLLEEWRRRWFGEDLAQASPLFRNPHALGTTACGKGATPAPVPSPVQPATTVVAVRGHGRGR
jgi:hypothetical protein